MIESLNAFSELLITIFKVQLLLFGICGFSFIFAAAAVTGAQLLADFWRAHK